MHGQRASDKESGSAAAADAVATMECDDGPFSFEVLKLCLSCL